MAVPGIYRKPLPSPPAIDFASPRGKQLFMEALEGGNMEGFFKLISCYQTQSEPAFCGLSSLSMVLNALSIDPGRMWKGPWRWFDDSMLDCCEPLEKIKVEGISFGKLACLAHCNGADVQAYRANESAIDAFRRYVELCAASEDCHIITSYHRKHFKQTGTGHFSPIGGYHAGRDMVLILDVARFKYPPHWVPLALLWEAMNTTDDATGLFRGFMMISRLQKPPSILFTLSCRQENWNIIAKYLIHEVPVLLKSKEIKEVDDILSVVITSLPSNFQGFIRWVAEVRRQEDGTATLSEEEKGRLLVKGEVLKQVEESKLYEHVTKWFVSHTSCCKDVIFSKDKDGLAKTARKVRCHGAELLTGICGPPNTICCKEVNVKSWQTNGEEPVTMVSGAIVSDGTEKRIDMLVPSSQQKLGGVSDDDFGNCCSTHPSKVDVVAVLLLALPQHTWACIKEEKLQEEIISLVTVENLPPLLQQEVLHLRRQLHFLARDLGL